MTATDNARRADGPGGDRHIRLDDGPEFNAGTLRAWLKRGGIGTLGLEPGSPKENGSAESFHARLQDELWT